ncbi:peptidylprolyl isomerase [Psychroserpens sp. Hel_I_66]|uniref:peptidylprolyl isomerase n=1 Tax=Psychroserpens sp. Hel_I_66 TaxID=1250004 RepID=UPI000647BED2|nr:peptidylprolyl isomerase [Psychroserpens sp. Hel_I_66]
MSKTLQLLILCLIVTLVSCKEEYPDLEDGLYAEIVTSKDTMIAKLFYDKVPVTVANFVALAEGNHPMMADEFKGKPYYDSLTFHRVMDKFMIQGGDHTATGGGNPGYKFTADFDPSLKHDKGGLLSMANSGGFNTNGSQFFITEVPYPSLNAYDDNGELKNCDQPRTSCHSVFGELVKGIEVQDAISNVEVTPGSNKPVEPVYITKINIIRKGSAAKSFNAPKVFEKELPNVEAEIQQIQDDKKEKLEQEQKEREEKIASASEETKPMLEDYATKTTALASGLKKYVIKEGTGPKPKAGDSVRVYYEGYFTDGKLFDSDRVEIAEKYGMFNQRRADANAYGPTAMLVSPNAQMIPGFKEALANLKVGEKAFFYLPSHLAYGERGNRGIPPNTDLTFIVEMESVIKR